MPDTTPVPTDDEIMELAKPFITRVGSHWEHDDAIPDNGRIEEFARAVLARWGAQPAPAASPAPKLESCLHEIEPFGAEEPFYKCKHCGYLSTDHREFK